MPILATALVLPCGSIDNDSFTLVDMLLIKQQQLGRCARLVTVACSCIAAARHNSSLCLLIPASWRKACSKCQQLQQPPLVLLLASRTRLRTVTVHNNALPSELKPTALNVQLLSTSWTLLESCTELTWLVTQHDEATAKIVNRSS